MKFSIAFLALCFSFSYSPATIYYVLGASGDNSNPGTPMQPWETIQYGIDQAQPGDTVWVGGGVYSEKVSFNASGAPGNYITLYGDPANMPVIDGTALAPNGREGLVNIDSQSFIEFSGFEIRDFATASSNTPVGILVTGSAHDIRMFHNDIHHIAHFGASNSEGANGIGVYGTDADTAIHNLFIANCEVRDCNTLASEAFVLNGNVRDFQLCYNRVFDCDNIAMDFIGYEGECANCTGNGGANADRVRNGIVRQNIVWNIDSKDNPNPDYAGERSAAAFYVDGGSGIIFEQNMAFNCNFGFELASEHFGRSTDSIIVRNNVLYNNHVLGISLGGYDSGMGPGGGSAENCVVVNNSLYNNHTSTRPQDDFGAEIYLQNRCLDNTFKNNVVYATAGRARVLEDGILNSGNVFGTNLYFGSNVGTAQGQTVGADPLFLDVSNGNLKLGNGSPAVDVGENLSVDLMGTEDFDGGPRVIGNVVDLGAYEREDSTVSFPEALGAEEVMRLYPNPVGDHCWLRLSEKIKVEGMHWVDALGRRIEALWWLRGGGVYRVETSYLPEGAYILQVKTDGRMEAMRVVK